jgi:hypothetical protein
MNRKESSERANYPNEGMLETENKGRVRVNGSTATVIHEQL